jgi:hypothetical protein
MEKNLLEPPYSSGVYLSLLPSMSGFGYKTLGGEKGKNGRYNAQFYNGWGGMGNTKDYDKIIKYGFKPDKVVAGVLTNEVHGNGYIDLDTLRDPSRSSRTNVALTRLAAWPGVG